MSFDKAEWQYDSAKPAVTSWSLMSLRAAAVAIRPAHVFQTEKSRPLWAGSGSYGAEISTETRPPLRILDTRTPLCCFQAGGEDTSFPARSFRRYDVRSIRRRWPFLFPFLPISSSLP